MQKIFSGRTLVGIKVSAFADGSVPITPEKEALQFVSLKHPKGMYLKAHYHNAKQVVASRVQESVIVRKGKVRLDLYGPPPRCRLVKQVILQTGEVFLLLNGGYGITMLEDSELWEHKNGPFMNDKVLI